MFGGSHRVPATRPYSEPAPRDEPLLLDDLAPWSMLREGFAMFGPRDLAALLAALGGERHGSQDPEQGQRADRRAVDSWIVAERHGADESARAWGLVVAGLAALSWPDRSALANALALDCAGLLARKREAIASQALERFGAGLPEIQGRLADARGRLLERAQVRKLARALEIDAAAERRREREAAEDLARSLAA